MRSRDRTALMSDRFSYQIRLYSPPFTIGRRDVGPERLYKVSQASEKGDSRHEFGINTFSCLIFLTHFPAQHSSSFLNFQETHLYSGKGRVLPLKLLV
jgi:hypothetical protein